MPKSRQPTASISLDYASFDVRETEEPLKIQADGYLQGRSQKSAYAAVQNFTQVSQTFLAMPLLSLYTNNTIVPRIINKIKNKFKT
jgi:hypothetical protein